MRRHFQGLWGIKRKVLELKMRPFGLKKMKKKFQRSVIAVRGLGLLIATGYRQMIVDGKKRIALATWITINIV